MNKVVCANKILGMKPFFSLFSIVSRRSYQDDLYVYNLAQLDDLLQANGVAAEDVDDTTDAIWAAMGYASADAFSDDLYDGNGILKADIVAAIPSGNNLLTDLVAYWAMEEAGGVRADSSANSRDLSEPGTVASRTGKNGDAADFPNDPANYLTRPDEAALRFGGKDISASFWVEFDTLGTDRTLVCKWSNTTSEREFLLRYNATATAGIELIWYNAGGTSDVRFKHTTAISTGVPYHISFGRDNTNNEIFISVNGTKQTAESTSSNSGAAALVLGNLFSSSSPHDGYLDEFCIHSRYYSDTDLSNLYGLGSGLFFDSFDSGS